MPEKVIAIDLDGTCVIGRPYKGPLDFPPLRPGTAAFFQNLHDLDYEIIIHTARSDRGAVREYLRKNGVSRFVSEVTNVKPARAGMFVDDRALEFNGDYKEALQKIKSFKPHWEHGDKDDLPPHKFSSTQVNITGPIADTMQAMAGKIEKQDLIQKDDEEPCSHVTVCYGLDDEQPGKLVDLLRKEKPGTIRFGKTIVFPDSGDGDVVVIEVESAGLRYLHKLIAENMECSGNTHPDFRPHATLAYVNAGKGKKYAGDMTLNGKTYGFHSVLFSSKNRTTEEIPLEG